MTPLRLTMNLGDEPWTDVGSEKPVHGVIERIGFLPDGTANGRPSVAVLIRLDNGQAVFAETTAVLFINAANAARVRYGIEAGTWGAESQS